MQPRLIVGLTGGMGCGKSTAARYFQELGWERIDSDQVIRDVILQEPEVLEAAATLFGPSAVTDGSVNRSVVGPRVFSDPKALEAWEKLIHPRLYAHWSQRFADRQTTRWIVEVPLLFEKRLEKWFDFIVCVATTSDLQLVRLAERGMSQALAEQRISKQLPLVYKIEHAHFVLSNDGSADFLRDQVARLSAHLSARS